MGPATPPDELYTYGMMLGLQPYLDEQLMAAALGQREQLVLVGGLVAAAAGGGSVGAGGGTPVAAALRGREGRGAEGSVVKR